jgi:hypothetical protein
MQRLIAFLLEVAGYDVVTIQHALRYFHFSFRSDVCTNIQAIPTSILLRLMFTYTSDGEWSNERWMFE